MERFILNNLCTSSLYRIYKLNLNFKNIIVYVIGEGVIDDPLGPASKNL